MPEALSDFLSPRPASVPCRNLEICAYLDDELLAFSFLDIGENATSAVYAAFEPTEHKRSLGIFTMLVAIGYSREITAVNRDFIMDHYRAYGGPEPPAIDPSGGKNPHVPHGQDGSQRVP